MRPRALVVLVSLGFVLTGCAPEPDPDPVMPDVLGQRLDVATSDIERAGIEDEIEVLGGGVLGVIDETNWHVCEQSPGPGAVAEGVRLMVERSCDDDDEANRPGEAPSDEAADDSQELEESELEASTDPEPDESEPDSSSGVDAQMIEDTFLVHLENNGIARVGEMCDSAFTHWACFYDGVEDAPGFLRIQLTTDGGWSDDALGEMADLAGRHWFNFIGCDFPDLSTSVVAVNGIDHNVFRSDTQVDLMCN